MLLISVISNHRTVLIEICINKGLTVDIEKKNQLKQNIRLEEKNVPTQLHQTHIRTLTPIVPVVVSVITIFIIILIIVILLVIIGITTVYVRRKVW